MSGTPFEQLANLDRLVHDPARLAILTALSACERADFLFLLRITGLTKGNLSSHLSKLEEAGLVEIEKRFVEKKTQTLARLSDQGARGGRELLEGDGRAPRERRAMAAGERGAGAVDGVGASRQGNVGRRTPFPGRSEIVTPRDRSRVGGSGRALRARNRAIAASYVVTPWSEAPRVRIEPRTFSRQDRKSPPARKLHPSARAGTRPEQGRGVAYAPIENYGVIGNMRTAALVGKHGSIDWFCFPHFDSPSVFAAILDDEKGGRFEIAPVGDGAATKQLYWPDTNVLITRFLSADGVGEIEDFMPVGGGGADDWRDHLIRRVRVVRGAVTFHVRCHPAFDYARAPHETVIDPGQGRRSSTRRA